MPIYEFGCNSCRKRSSLFVRSVNQSFEPACQLCGSKDVKRLVSSFAIHRTDADRMASIDTSTEPGADYYSDGRNVGLWAKKRLEEMGATDMVPQIDEIVEKGRSGELLKEYESAAAERYD